MLPISPFSETSAPLSTAKAAHKVSTAPSSRWATPVRPGKCCACWATCWACKASTTTHRKRSATKLFGKGVTDLSAKLNNIGKLAPQAAAVRQRTARCERIADVPIYFADAIARRSEPLLQRRRPAAEGSPVERLAEQLGVNAGDASRSRKARAAVAGRRHRRAPAGQRRACRRRPSAPPRWAPCSARSPLKAGEGK